MKTQYLPFGFLNNGHSLFPGFRYSCIYIILASPLLCAAQANMQPQVADSLWSLWQDETKTDSIRLKAIFDFTWTGYLFSKPDSAFYYAQLQYEYANSKGLKVQMADALNTQGISFAIRGNYDKAIDYFIKSLKIKEEVGDLPGVANLLNNIGIIHEDQGDYPKAIQNYLQSLAIQEEFGNKRGMANSLNNIGNSYYNQNEFEKAIAHHLRSLEIRKELDDKKAISESLNNLGLIYDKQGDYGRALDCFSQSLKLKEEFGDKQAIANSLRNIGFLYFNQGKYTSALSYCSRALETAQEVGSVLQIRDAAYALWKVNKKLGNYKAGLEMYELYTQIRDSIMSEENEKEVIRQEIKYSYEKQAAADSVANAKAVEVKNAQIAQHQAEIKVKKNQQYGLFGGLGLMFILAGSAYYRFQSKKKANEVLQRAMADLKSTQALLIQTEKMASLGELTAGIAHEIQNPLNFVNNFSEVSVELVDESIEEVEAVKTSHALSAKEEESLIEITNLLGNVKSNLEKITHHGKRADAIVKGMLAHSRSGKGEKAPTDINALAEEYLKLSFHGLRAKDKNFNPDFKTDFDPDLPKLNVVSQDIGRVLLNLINNAFQACNGHSEKPTVTVSTRRVAPILLGAGGGTGGSAPAILITVSDNGPGIHDAIKDKIFQPFFTTKPTGEGTGLGLSLSYDIVKAHGGEITYSSKVGTGTEFIIKLPHHIQ